jgi:hypothetical protein
MASTTENAPKDATEDPKLDVFEDDDEFEEFENEGKGGKNLSHHWVSWEDSSFSQMVFRVGVWFCCSEGLKDMLTLFFGGISEFDCTGGVCNLWF